MCVLDLVSGLPFFTRAEECVISAEMASTKGVTESDVKEGTTGSGSAGTVEPGDMSTMSSSIIDMDIFGQLLEMDDEEDREFSKEIVWNYFDQAESTFEKMDKAL